MKYKVKIAASVALPTSKGLITAMKKGAAAWRDGKPISDNIYEADTSEIHYRAWSRGWKLADVGLITVQDPGSPGKFFSHQVERV